MQAKTLETFLHWTCHSLSSSRVQFPFFSSSIMTWCDLHLPSIIRTLSIKTKPSQETLTTNMNSNDFYLLVCLGKAKSPSRGQENTKRKWTDLAGGVQHGTGRGDETRHGRGCLPFLCTRYMALEGGPVEDKVGRYLFYLASYLLFWEPQNPLIWWKKKYGQLESHSSRGPQFGSCANTTKSGYLSMLIYKAIN